MGVRPKDLSNPHRVIWLVSGRVIMILVSIVTHLSDHISRMGVASAVMTVAALKIYKMQQKCNVMKRHAMLFAP